MKKKITNFVVFSIISVSFLFLTPVPKAQAASVDAGQLLELMASEETAAAIQEIAKVGAEVKKGDTSTLKNIIFKKALEKAGISGPVNELIINDVKDIADSVISGNNKNAIAKAVENAVKEKAKARLSERLAPYQDTILVLAGLLGQSNLTPQAAKKNDNLTGSPQNYTKIVNMTATAYAPGPLDNGKWNDKTYVGGKVKKGVAAVDPAIIPMGTRLWVEGYGEALAEDQGSAIKGNRIDLAFNEREDALAYGIQNVKVYVLD